MTVTEMHLQFKFGMDKLDSLNYPNFLETEIDLLLNQAQDRLVKTRYSGNNNLKESYEETQKRSEDLKNITYNAFLLPGPVLPVDGIDLMSRFITLPTDHWFIIQERCVISYTDCNNQSKTDVVEVRPTQHSEFSKIIKDPFKRPNLNKVLRLMENKRVELVSAPGVTITGYRLRYIKEPVRIDLNTLVDCELSNHLHQEIVDSAIQIALEGVEAKRNQTFTPIINNQQE